MNTSYLSEGFKEIFDFKKSQRKNANNEYYDEFQVEIHVVSLDTLFGEEVYLLEKGGRMKEINEAIEKSKYMLNLEDNWDGEGAVACNYMSWERAINFLRKITKMALNSYNIVIDAPKISYGVDGSIDMFWKTPKYKLLAAFPKDETNVIPFFGKTIDNETMEGTFTLDGGKNLMIFLVGQKNV